ncbi:MAG: hypothetical protein L0241_11030 [Planctomycetia bacterium]|nr:hypothetical protein [Planctomycetia bacterium]
MRELQVCLPEKRSNAGVVHRLQFSASGDELVAWVEAKRNGPFGRLAGVTRWLYAYDLTANTTRVLPTDDWFSNWNYASPDPRVSPDVRFAATEINHGDYETNGYVIFNDILNPDVQLPELDFPPMQSSELLFTPDSSALIAVRNPWDDRGVVVPDIVRFEMTTFTKPPLRYKPDVGYFTGQPVRKLKRIPRWKDILTFPPGELAWDAAISADGQFIAVGTEETTVHVAELKRKKVIATFPWEGRKLKYTAVNNIAFDPSAKWVVFLAHRRLFARPLADGKGWNTKGTLGWVHDFAFHPSGRFLCAVFDDGRARYFDPLTGAIQQTFRWGKKSLYSVCFAPDGLTCTAGCASGKVIVWDVDV